MRLRHLHLPSLHPHYVPYSLACRVQEHFRRQHLDFKDAPPSPSSSSPPPPPPPPTLISFTPHPIYTLGRRQTTPLSAAETARLTAPLTVSPYFSSSSSSSSSPSSTTNAVRLPVRLRRSPRGGLLTYHGPGQAVLWPVLDLRPAGQQQQCAPYKPLTVRCYARLLEETTVGTLARVFGLAAFTTSDPGVWVRARQQRGGEEEMEGEEGLAKIAALGVHLRRHVTALGTALNVAMPGTGTGTSVPPALRAKEEREQEQEKEEEEASSSNPWARIVACGLEGRGVTSVAGMLRGGGAEVDALLAKAGYGVGGGDGGGGGGGGVSVSDDDDDAPGPAGRGGRRERMAAAAWADEFARRVGLEGVDGVGAEEVLRLMERLVREGEGEEEDIGEGVEKEREEEREYLARMSAVLLRS